MKYDILFHFCVTIALALIASHSISTEKKTELLEARLHCVEDQIGPIIDYERRMKNGTWPAAVDPPYTYCDYLENQGLLLDYERSKR